MLKHWLKSTLRSQTTLIVGIVLFLCLWVGNVLSLFGDPVSPISTSVFGFDCTLGISGQVILSITLFLLDVFLLYRIINEFELFNIRTTFAPGLFIALIGGSTFLIPLHTGNVCLPMMMLVLYILLSTYQQRHAISEYVTGFALLGCITILSPKWILLTPVIIVGCGLIQSLTPRTFMAAVIGLIIPYWIGGGVLFLFDETAHFADPFIQLAEFCPIRYGELTIQQLSATILLLVLAVPSMLHYPGSSFGIREKARVCYNFFFALFACTLILILLQPCLISEFYPLLAAIACLFVTQMLLSAKGRGGGIYLLLLSLLYLIYITEPIWTDLLIS